MRLLLLKTGFLHSMLSWTNLKVSSHLQQKGISETKIKQTSLGIFSECSCHVIPYNNMQWPAWTHPYNSAGLAMLLMPERFRHWSGHVCPRVGRVPIGSSCPKSCKYQHNEFPQLPEGEEISCICYAVAVSLCGKTMDILSPLVKFNLCANTIKRYIFGYVFQ